MMVLKGQIDLLQKLATMGYKICFYRLWKYVKLTLNVQMYCFILLKDVNTG